MENREIHLNGEIKKDSLHYQRKKKENFENLTFNIQILKSSTDHLIQSIINNNKYLIEYEKKKLKDNQEDEEEIM